MKPLLLNELFVDEDFFATAKIKLTEGRNFQNKNEFKTAFIVNEQAVKELGWTNPIGKKITVGVPNVDDGVWSEGNIIGVVKDFNTRSLHKSIEPLVIRLQYDSWPGSCLNIRYYGSQQEVVTKIKKVYDRILPGFLMDYERVDERYENQYKADRKAYTTLQASTWIIISISCIGIFSISVFMSVKRQREFGIRKIVGATVAQITSLHINPFLKIAVGAMAISLPFAYWVLKWWLSDFVYKEELSVFPFLISGSLLILLIFSTAGYSAWKSGRMNPIDVIKTE
jgi:putative ABC transport system permease protein